MWLIYIRYSTHFQPIWSIFVPIVLLHLMIFFCQGFPVEVANFHLILFFSLCRPHFCQIRLIWWPLCAYSKTVKMVSFSHWSAWHCHHRPPCSMLLCEWSCVKPFQWPMLIKSLPYTFDTFTFSGRPLLRNCEMLWIIFLVKKFSPIDTKLIRFGNSGEKKRIMKISALLKHQTTEMFVRVSVCVCMCSYWIWIDSILCQRHRRIDTIKAGGWVRAHHHLFWMLLLLLLWPLLLLLSFLGIRFFFSSSC